MLVNISPYIGDNVYLVFCSKRHGSKKDIVIGCVIKRITIQYNEYKDTIIVEYLCESKKMITKGEKNRKLSQPFLFYKCNMRYWYERFWLFSCIYNKRKMYELSKRKNNK